MKLHKTIPLHDLKDGAMRSVPVNKLWIALIRVGDRVFAISDRCTHADCSLGTDGFLEGNTITCGCHGGQTDITTGKALSYPVTEDAKVYKTIIKDSYIFIEL